MSIYLSAHPVDFRNSSSTYSQFVFWQPALKGLKENNIQFRIKWPQGLGIFLPGLKRGFKLKYRGIFYSLNSYLFPVWDCCLQNKKIKLFKDKTSLVNILNLLSSPSKVVMKLMRLFVLYVLQNNIIFRSEQIEGKANSISCSTY